MYYFLLPLSQLHEFARAGGGGSSGGGSGGGGGGLSAIALIGYVPAHFVAKWGSERFDRLVGILLGAAVGILVTVPCIWLGWFFAFLVGVGAVIGVRSGVNNWLGRFKKRITRAKTAVRYAASQDPAWQESNLQDTITKVFYAYQDDWSKFNLAGIQTYTDPEYFRHAQLMLAALKQMGRQNTVGSPKLLGAQVVDVYDRPDNDDDTFSAAISASANDLLIDTQNNRVLYTDNSDFEEIWWFGRSGDRWLLQRIEQVTADSAQASPVLERFARDNSMYYSLDWGWLLLPQRGQLFSKASFKKSDVNNHVIGLWNGNIVQLYTYIPLKNTAENYLVAQITLPKSYGGIIIKRKSKGILRLWSTTPRGYRRVRMEWPDFNGRYDVYATDMDKVTSFELLNPKFMADLYDKDLMVSIEVVDNVVYLYASMARQLVSGSRERYAAMLDVLQAAFKELKL